MNSRWISAIALTLCACGHRESGAPSGGEGAASTSGGAGARAAAMDAAESAADAAASEGGAARDERAGLREVPSVIAQGEAVILAATLGGSVTMQREGAAPIELRDGERVRVIQENIGLDQREQTVEVEARSTRGLVANTAVITEERLRRSSDGRWAVMHAYGECGDFCHAALLLLGPEGARRSLCGEELCASPDWTVSFSADGASVAVGSVDLRVTALSGGAVRTIEGFGSPAYSPQGRLFARKLAESDDAVYEVSAAGEPRRVYAPRGRPPRPDPETPRSPPSAPVFEQDGAVLCADFMRGARLVYARASLEGRAAPGAQRCAAAR